MERKGIIHFMPIILISVLLLASCRQPAREVHEVDFSEGDTAELRGDPDPGALRVAISTVISPRESFIYYQEMFEALSESIGISVEFKQRGTYAEVNDLLAQNLVDMAFICSGAYISGSDHHELMFVPVVSGEPYYRGYIITNKNSGISRFEDLRGKRFTYSDPLCFTGSLFIDRRMESLGTDTETFFGEIVYSLSHDVSIQMVSRNLIDGAAVNGLIFDYLRKNRPEYIEDVEIIEITGPGGIPPVVNSLLMPRELRNEIQDFFLGMHENDNTREILDNLLIDKFIIAGDTLYDGLREIKYSMN